MEKGMPNCRRTIQGKTFPKRKMVKKTEALSNDDEDKANRH